MDTSSKQILFSNEKEEGRTKGVGGADRDKVRCEGTSAPESKKKKSSKVVKMNDVLVSIPEVSVPNVPVSQLPSVSIVVPSIVSPREGKGLPAENLTEAVSSGDPEGSSGREVSGIG